jgi:hypothetical protein
MIHAGFVIESPLTQPRTLVLESDAETNGMSWLLEITCLPGRGPDIAEHLHLSWTESFEIIQGAAHYTIDRVKKIAQAGETFVVKPGQFHQHPWTVGDAQLIYRQRSDFGRSDPGAVQEVLGVFATIAGLARKGKIDSRGLPKNPLQLAATLRTLSKYGGYDRSPPMPV